MHRSANVVFNHRYLGVWRTADYDELNRNWHKPCFYLNLTIYNFRNQVLELFPKLHKVEWKYKHRFCQFLFSSQKSAVRWTSSNYITKDESYNKRRTPTHFSRYMQLFNLWGKHDKWNRINIVMHTHKNKFIVIKIFVFSTNFQQSSFLYKISYFSSLWICNNLHFEFTIFKFNRFLSILKSNKLAILIDNIHVVMKIMIILIWKEIKLLLKLYLIKKNMLKKNEREKLRRCQ